MKSFKFPVIALFCILIQIPSYGQLSGYYTIGGTFSNYSTIGEAMQDLYTQGISDDVVFQLNPGNYSGWSFDAIPGASATNTFEIRSVSLDSSDVIINGAVSFYECAFITLRALTISNDYGKAINCIRSKAIFVKNCDISSAYHGVDDEAAVNIEQKYETLGDITSITFSHCIITSPTLCIYNKYEYGAITIRNCNVNSTTGLSLLCDFSQRIKLYNCTFNGGLNLDGYYQIVVKGNYVSGEINFGLADSISFNTFQSTSRIDISGKYFEGNYFLAPYFVDYHDDWLGAKKFINNYFESEINMFSAKKVYMTGNTFLSDISLDFNQVLHFDNNIMYGDLNYGDTYTGYWDYRIQNNIFIGGCLVARGHHTNISYNNFIENGYLWYEFSDIKVHDNNFCRGIDGAPDPLNISHNNYYPMIYCFYDTNSVHYNPVYSNSNTGMATNPILQGKGWSAAPEFDFQGNKRKTPPAIGANEIFICSDSMNNILTVPCGEQVYLNMCSLPDTGSSWWTPDTCILYADSAYTAVTACNNRTWYLHNSVYGLIDSVSAQVIPFDVEIAEMPTFRCGWARTLNATYNVGATYHWTPETGLSNPYIRNPLLYIDDTTNLKYILECNVAGCGTSYDTINIDYDPRPYVNMYYPDQHNDTVYFMSSSTCVDTYLWDFGDGSFSGEENPVHIYKNQGYYTVKLKGTNGFASDSVTYSIYLYWISVPEDLREQEIQVFPNPANVELEIKGLSALASSRIALFTTAGEEMIRDETRSEEHKLDLRNLSDGVYLLRISTQSHEYNRKIVVIH
jgi:hypothetical protein